MDEYDVLGGYLPSFVQHLEDTRARFGLGMVSQDCDAGGSVDDSVWTPGEREAFFRALSVHSRWRPDLIAACVPTKAEWEVWMYLEALEEGAAALAAQRSGGGDVDMVSGDSGDEDRDVEMQADGPALSIASRSDADTDTDENTDDEELCEPALEVSRAWIDAEERMASWIIQEEHYASIGGDTASDTESVAEEPRKRKRGRPRGTRRDCPPSQRRQVVVEESLDSSLATHRSPSPEPSTFAHKPSTTTQNEREALLSHLGASHLLVLDGILREGVEALKSREDSLTGMPGAEHGYEREPYVGDVQAPIASEQDIAPQGTGGVSESSSTAMIDPVLLALSGDADPAEPQGTFASRAPTHVPTQGPPLPHSQPLSLDGAASMLMLAPSDATHTNPPPTANAESDLSLFSPRSRRRIQKRLYMRRKRAMLRDNGEGAVDTGIEKLKPGKKAKSRASETPAESASVALSEVASDAESEVVENAPRKNKGGLTLPYKLKARFAELGVDAAYLGSQRMDLLNLGALGKLMGLYSSLEHGEEEQDGPTTAHSIDARLIQHLQAAMVSFVTDIIHRAIVWREMEIKLKQRNQAWRQSNHVTIAAVEHAVAAVGGRYCSHKAYLESLAPQNSSEEADHANASFADPDVEAADRPAGMPRPSPHREVYAPLIRAPAEWRLGALACFTQTYEGEASRTRRGPSADNAEEALMPAETDEEALEAELDGDEAADGRDTELAGRAEARLWEETKI